MLGAIRDVQQIFFIRSSPLVISVIQEKCSSIDANRKSTGATWFDRLDVEGGPFDEAPCAPGGTIQLGHPPFDPPFTPADSVDVNGH